MKHGKTLFLLAFIFAAAAAFAGEALPADAADWPAKLGMTPKMLFLVLQIGIIIFAAKIGGSLATTLKLPSVLGELGAGILIGPWALGGFPIPGFDGMFQYGIFYGKALRAQAAAGGNPFMEYAVPEAVLKFRQGIGRLIRTADDRGVITVLDSRLLGKRYGMKFLRSLPEYPRKDFGF